MEQRITIRLAGWDDVGALARLRWDFSAEDASIEPVLFDEFERAFQSFWSAALADRTWCCWVAQRDSDIVTTMYVQLVGMVPRPGQLRRRYGYVASVYTRPAVRNLGIGSLVLRRMIAWARAEGLESLVLWPSEESVRFYERLGFRPNNGVLELDLHP